MMGQVTIIMYHYIRDVETTRFPGIKAQSLAGFRGQLEYITRYYQVVSAEELAEAICDPAYRLPANAVLLTFDDGYVDHYTTVVPMLIEYGVSGVFSPVARAVSERRVLDVNKVHFILASASDNVGGVVEALFALMDLNRAEFGLRTNESYWSRLAGASRFDSAEVIFIKRMLQRELPEELRRRITDELFRRHVTADERGFACELYMNETQLRAMREAGMSVASHSYDHCWLGTLPPQRQAEEIDRSLEFLGGLGIATDGWMMVYPYGSWNESLCVLLRDRGCIAGFTTEVAIAGRGADPLLLPRLDTNDLPTGGDSQMACWTRRVV